MLIQKDYEHYKQARFSQTVTNDEAHDTAQPQHFEINSKTKEIVLDL